MNLAELKELLWYSLAVNYLMLMVWFAAFTLLHDTVYRLHARWFRLSVETFDAIHYAAMALYKLGIFLLHVAPLIALHVLKAD